MKGIILSTPVKLTKHKLLKYFFKIAYIQSSFHPNGKRQMLILHLKKGDKQCMKNYCPVFLLPVCGKVFEWLLYNNIISFFSENDLISLKQSGFRPGDSCTNQLLSIAHEILAAFDDCHEVRGVFLS